MCVARVGVAHNAQRHAQGTPVPYKAHARSRSLKDAHRNDVTTDACRCPVQDATRSSTGSSRCSKAHTASAACVAVPTLAENFPSPKLWDPRIPVQTNVLVYCGVCRQIAQDALQFVFAGLKPTITTTHSYGFFAKLLQLPPERFDFPIQGFCLRSPGNLSTRVVNGPNTPHKHISKFARTWNGSCYMAKSAQVLGSGIAD